MTDARQVSTDDILGPLDEVLLEVGTGENRRTVKARVTRVLRDGLVVALPADARDLALVPEAFGVQIVRAAREAMFVVRARRVTMDPPSRSLLTLRQEGEWQRIQRREDVRLRIMLDTQLEVPAEGEAQRVIDAALIDVSAGGMLVQSKETLSERDRVVAIFKLPGQETPLEVDAEVVRVVPVEDGRWQLFRIGLRFVRLLERERVRIVRFIFQEQAKIRRLDAEREWKRKG